MDISTPILTFTAALFVVEIYGLITGKLQQDVSDRPAVCIALTVVFILVLLAQFDSAGEGSESRVLLYSVVSLFNIALFGTLAVKALIAARRDNRQVAR